MIPDFSHCICDDFQPIQDQYHLKLHLNSYIFQWVEDGEKQHSLIDFSTDYSCILTRDSENDLKGTWRVNDNMSISIIMETWEEEYVFNWLDNFGKQATRSKPYKPEQIYIQSKQ